MRTTTDVKDRTVGFSVPSGLYSEDAVRIAAAVFSSRAEVYAGQARGRREITLKAARPLDAQALAALAGEFANELLNQEARFVTGRFNQKISSLVVTQALFSARGGETPPAPCEAEQTPEFKAAVEKLMREASDEVERTMPKKLPPQGTPLPPAPEELGA